MSKPEYQQDEGFDIPQGPEITTSSIGSLDWPPTNEGQSFERFKGIYPKLVTSPDELRQIIADIISCDLNDEASRVSVRAVISMDVLIGFQDNLKLIETIIPLHSAGIPAFKDAALVYFGNNTAERNSGMARDLERNVADIFSQRTIKTPRDLPEGYTVRPLTDSDKNDASIQQDYAELYRLFGWEDEEIIELLTTPSNILVAGFHHGKVVASGIAESGSLPIQHGNEPQRLNLAEITEAATRVEHRGKGLYTNISYKLLSHLAEIDQPPNIVFGEMNSESDAVLKTAAGQGRLVGLDTAYELGFPHATHLSQHVTIHSGLQIKRKNRYNDLVVGWISQTDLIEYYGRD